MTSVSSHGAVVTIRNRTNTWTSRPSLLGTRSLTIEWSAVHTTASSPNTAKITRWDSVFQAVQKIVGGFEATIHFGANLFPNKSAQQVYNANACLVNANVEIKVKAKNQAAILAGIPPANTMTIYGGSTEVQKNIISRRKLGLPKNF